MDSKAQLWSSERIIAESEALGAYLGGDWYKTSLEIRGLCQRVRNEMQTRINALEAQLAEAGQWEPVPDGMEYFESRGLAYSVWNNGEAFVVGLEQGGGHFKWPDNIRLCRRVEPTGEQAECHS